MTYRIEVYIDTSDDRRSHRGHREEAMLPRAIVGSPLVQTEEILKPAGNFRIDREQVSDVMPTPADLPRTIKHGYSGAKGAGSTDHSVGE